MSLLQGSKYHTHCILIWYCYMLKATILTLGEWYSCRGLALVAHSGVSPLGFKYQPHIHQALLYRNCFRGLKSIYFVTIEKQYKYYTNLACHGLCNSSHRATWLTAMHGHYAYNWLAYLFGAWDVIGVLLACCLAGEGGEGQSNAEG